MKVGGLYLLDWCVQYETPLETEGGVGWEMEAGGIKVGTTVSWKAVDRVEQLFEETQVLDVDDHGKKVTLTGTVTKRAIYPQEFLFLVSTLRHWEFVGWWNNWSLQQPLREVDQIDRPIALLRRV